MAKIKLLLGAGIPYAATTPLWYTLQWDNKYCHTGHRKEPHWLDVIQKQQELKYNPGWKKGNRLKDRRRKFVIAPVAYLKPEKPAEIQRTSFTSEEEEYFFSLPTSIDKYIEYYKKHWESVKNEVQSVADFSNSTCQLKKEFMLDIREKMLEVFDVKVIMIFRDPIRRIWSQAKTEYKNIYNEKGKPNNLCHYDQMYTKHCEVWGKENVLPLIMERAWKDPSELSDFLGYKIEKMHRNVYYPEMGSKRPKYKYLDDQWSGERNDIDYGRLRKELDWLYVNFEKTFGYLPEEWSP